MSSSQGGLACAKPDGDLESPSVKIKRTKGDELLRITMESPHCFIPFPRAHTQLLTTRKVTITLDLIENADGRLARILMRRPSGLLPHRTTMAFKGCAQEVTLKPRSSARRVIGPRS
jgi:hypothetical protein